MLAAAVLLALSAFLPWQSVLGFPANRSGAATLVIVLFAAGIGLLAWRFAHGKKSAFSLVAVWVLFALGALVVVGVIATTNTSSEGGLISYDPGFFFAILSLVVIAGSAVVIGRRP